MIKFLTVKDFGQWGNGNGSPYFLPASGKSLAVEQEAHLMAAEAVRFRALYYELLTAVRMKYEGENRHETALRYIKEAEHFPIVEPAQCKCP